MLLDSSDHKSFGTRSAHSISAQYQLRISSVSAQYLLSIRKLFTQYSQTIHSVFAQCLVSIHSVLAQYFLSIRSVFTRYSLSIHYINSSITISSLCSVFLSNKLSFFAPIDKRPYLKYTTSFSHINHPLYQILLNGSKSETRSYCQRSNFSSG